MEQRQQWQSPEFDPLTDTDARADQADIPVRNGNDLISGGDT